MENLRQDGCSLARLAIVSVCFARCLMSSLLLVQEAPVMRLPQKRHKYLST